MRLKMLLLGSAAMLFASGAAQAQSSLVVGTQTGPGDVFSCGSGGIMKPGSEFCYRWYGEYEFETQFGFELDYGSDPSATTVEGVGPASHPSWSGWNNSWALGLIITRMTPKGPIELRFPVADNGSVGSDPDSFRLRIGSTSANYWEFAAGSSPYVQYRLRSTLWDFTWRVTDTANTTGTATAAATVTGPIPDLRVIAASRSGLSDFFSHTTQFDWGQRTYAAPAPAGNIGPLATNLWTLNHDWELEADLVTAAFNVVLAQVLWTNPGAPPPAVVVARDLGFRGSLEFDFDPLTWTVWGAWDRIDPNDPNNVDGSSSAWAVGAEAEIGVGDKTTVGFGATLARNAPAGNAGTPTSRGLNQMSRSYTGYNYSNFQAGNYLEIFGSVEVEWDDHVTTAWDVSYNTGPFFLAPGDANTIEIGVETTWVPWDSFDGFEVTGGVNHERQVGGLSATNATVGFTFTY